MPYVSVWVDDVELDEFDDTELIEELEKRGYSCVKGATSIDGIELISHLLDCGLVAYARDEALRMLEQQVGRPGVFTQREAS